MAHSESRDYVSKLCRQKVEEFKSVLLRSKNLSSILTRDLVGVSLTTVVTLYATRYLGSQSRAVDWIV